MSEIAPFTAKTSPETKGVAYSYVRFSTVKQELGDSLRRQVAMAEEYCAKHNLELHPVSYRDLGVSAFKRKNIEKGALASFMEAVRTEKVAKGSYLVIEQFDRLSRADVNKALRLLLDLVDAGIKLVTLVDEKVWDGETIKDTTNLILAIVYMSRANNESAAKAKRLSEAWTEKKKRAAQGDWNRIVTSECPRWLAPNEDKTGFVTLEDRVESIRKVFDMRINGYGIVAIVNRANKEKWPAPGKPPVRKSGESVEDFKLRATRDSTWHTSTVGRLLKNRALLGEYQPHKNDSDGDQRIPYGDPIPGYYPAVLDEAIFLRAQAKTDRSGRFPGRRDANLKNWLQGLLKCTCGQSIVRKNKESAAQPDYARYYCTARVRGVTKCPSSNAKEVETAVINGISHFAPDFFKGTARAETLRTRLDILEVETSVTRKARDNYLVALATVKSAAAAASLSVKLDETEETLKKCELESLSIHAELADLADDHESVFENIVETIRSIDNLDARAKLREELSRILSKIVIHETEGYIQIYLRAFETPVVHSLRADATLPGMEHNIAKIAPASTALTDEEKEYGKVEIDEQWWQEHLAKQKELRKQNSTS